MSLSIIDWSEMRGRRKYPTIPVGELVCSRYVGLYWPKLERYLNAYAKTRDQTLEALARQADVQLKYKVLRWLWDEWLVTVYPPSDRKEDLDPLRIRLLLLVDDGEDVCVLDIPPVANNQA